jgi:hypothetical protein
VRRHLAPAPTVSHPPERHIVLGVSHASDDPSRHRVFEVRASLDATAGGWVARIGEQNRNEQRGEWRANLSPGAQVRVFPTAAACLGDATAAIVTAFDRDTLAGRPLTPRDL